MKKIMKVEKVRLSTKGAIRAFFDVRTAEGFLIKDFKLLAGKKGEMFVGFPSEQWNGQWREKVFGSKALKEELLALAIVKADEEFAAAQAPGEQGGFVEPTGEDINF